MYHQTAFMISSSRLVWCRFYGLPRRISMPSKLPVWRSVWLYDTVAEWLRRWTRNPLGSARVGSNPTGVALFYFCREGKNKPLRCAFFEIFILRLNHFLYFDGQILKKYRRGALLLVKVWRSTFCRGRFIMRMYAGCDRRHGGSWNWSRHVPVDMGTYVRFIFFIKIVSRI